MTEQKLKIMAEPQFEPNKCQFSFEESIIEGGSFNFTSAEEAKGSPIAEALFAVQDVSQVFVSARSVMVSTQTPPDWRDVAAKIGTAIRQVVAENKPLISEELKSKIPSEDELRQRVDTVIKTEINPALASHGGFLNLLDVKHNDIYVEMGGGCQGCASSRMTLKHGIENALRKAIPYLGAVYDTTDHAAGMNPYYSG